MAISPDGARIAFAAVRKGEDVTRLFVRRLDDFDPDLIEGTEGAFHPFFSPDSERLGFFTEAGLYTVSLLGGQPVPLCAASHPHGASWGPDDTIIVGSGRLFQIPSAGGEPQHVTALSPLGPHGGGHWPQFLPGGLHVLFNPRFGGSIGVLSLETKVARTLVETPGSCARYALSGHLLYATRQGDLYAAPLDLERREITDRPVPVIAGLKTEEFGAAHYDVSDTGTLVYVPGGAVLGRLVWVERGASGQREAAWPDVDDYGAFRLSPDGSRLAVEVRGANSQIWILDFARREARQLTSEGSNWSPVWTHDGEEVFFSSLRAGEFGIYRKRVEPGAGAVKLGQGNRRDPRGGARHGQARLAGGADVALSRDHQGGRFLTAAALATARGPVPFTRPAPRHPAAHQGRGRGGSSRSRGADHLLRARVRAAKRVRRPEALLPREDRRRE